MPGSVSQRARLVNASVGQVQPGLAGNMIGGFLVNPALITCARAGDAAFVDPSRGFDWLNAEFEAHFEHDRDFSTWTLGGTPNIVSGLSDPDGGFNASSLEDDDAGAFETATEDGDVPDAMRVGHTYRVRLFIGRDTVETRFPEIQFKDHANAQTFYVDVNTRTGATAVRLASGWLHTEHTLVAYDDDWWLLEAYVASSNTNRPRLALIPAGGTVLGAANIAAVGVTRFYKPIWTSLGSWKASAEPRIVANRVVCEGARTNDLENFFDLENGTGWGNVNTPTHVARGPAPDGSRRYFLQGDDASSFEAFSNVVTLAASTTYTFSAYFKKDNDTSRYPALRVLTNVGAEDYRTYIGTSAGTAIRDAAFNAPDNIDIFDAGAWWHVQVTITTGVGETGGTVYLYPAMSSDGATSSASATGTCECWGVQFEAGGFATSVIRTFTTGITRDDDDNTIPDGGWDALKLADRWSVDFWLEWPIGDSPAGGTIRGLLYLSAQRVIYARYTGAAWEWRFYASRAGGAFSICAMPASTQIGDHMRCTVQQSTGDFRIDNLTRGTSAFDSTPGGPGDWNLAAGLDIGHMGGANPVFATVELPRAAA